MRKRIELGEDMTNVLELSNPDDCQCRVVSYSYKDQVMILEIADPTDILFYVVFNDVHYFDGAMLWKGANLRVASRDEQFDFMMDKSVIAALGDLCIFEGSNASVSLLAGTWIAILKKLPEGFT